MKFFFPLLLFVLILTFSCKENVKNDRLETTKKDTIAASKKNKRNISVSLQPTAKKELASWKEYQLVDEILSKFNTISNTEAISNAQELSELVTHLKDSIRDKRLKSPPVITRINILQNECLRLNDMAKIPAITPQEIDKEIDNILYAYAAFNAKINSVIAVRSAENELELDPDFESILNDTTIVTHIKNDKTKSVNSKGVDINQLGRPLHEKKKIIQKQKNEQILK